MLERTIALSLGAALVVFSGGAIIFGTWFSNDLDVERVLCRYSLICANDLVLDEAVKELWDPDANSHTTLAGFQESVRRNPHSSARWCDLGDAYLRVGDPEQAKYCYEQGVQLAPNAPTILLRAGNFYYATEDLRTSLSHFSQVLELVREYDAIILSQYKRMEASVRDVLSWGLPENAEAARAYLVHLSDEESVDDAGQVWDWMATRSMVEERSLARFVQLLLRKGGHDKAKNVHLLFAASQGSELPGEELVFNSGFESVFLGTPLDWSVRKNEAVEVRRDSRAFFGGKRALQIRFDGSTNLSYDHVAQTVVVSAGPHYISARVRAEDITTDRGVGLRIVDAERLTRLDFRTKAILGTTDWTTLEQEFTVPGETRLLRISVSRQSSVKIDSKIAGTVWLDDVSLVRK